MLLGLSISCQTSSPRSKTVRADPIVVVVSESIEVAGAAAGTSQDDEPTVHVESLQVKEVAHEGGDGQRQLKTFCCSVCNFKCRKKCSLKRHIEKKHKALDPPLPCPRSFCSLFFSTRWEKECHVSQCWLICERDLCHGKKFERPDKYEQHCRMHKKKDEWLAAFE